MNPGDRVELTELTDDYLPFGLTAGDLGTVAFTDSLCTIHIRWDRTSKRVGITREDTALLRAAPGPRHRRSPPVG
jgi:hypothetical protein